MFHGLIINKVSNVDRPLVGSVWTNLPVSVGMFQFICMCDFDFCIKRVDNCNWSLSHKKTFLPRPTNKNWPFFLTCVLHTHPCSFSCFSLSRLSLLTWQWRRWQWQMLKGILDWISNQCWWQQTEMRNQSWRQTLQLHPRDTENICNNCRCFLHCIPN